MLIGEGDINNDVITLDTCFSMFVYIRARFRFALIGGNLTAQSTGSHRGIGAAFSRPAARVPRRACSQAILAPASAYKFSSLISMLFL